MQSSPLELRTDELLPCPTQPPVRSWRVAELAEAWDEAELTPLRVYQKDGQWYIRNGQHRWLAALKRGITVLPCELAEGKDWALYDLHFWVTSYTDPRANCNCDNCAWWRRMRIAQKRPWGLAQQNGVH